MDINTILKNAEIEMKKLNHLYVGSEHLLLSILNSDSNVVDVFKKYNVNYKNFKFYLNRMVKKCSKKVEYVLHTPMYNKIIASAKEMAYSNNDKLNEEYLVLALLDENDGVAMSVLLEMNVDVDSLYDDIASMNTNIDIGYELDGDNILIGREKEIDQIFNTLLKKDKCNPLLIGNAGVGKTAIVEELSRRIKNNEVPDKLLGYKIINIDMSSLIAGTRYRGDFEEKLTKVVDEVKNKKIILFIDEIHTIVNAGGADGAINASDILKPYLSRGSIKVIGATTINEYNNSILKDKALNRRFNTIIIDETSYETTLDILLKVKSKYENFHNIEISDDCIKKILELSNKYIYNKYNPDKSLEVLDLVCANYNSKNNSGLILKKKEKYILNGEYNKARNLVCSNKKSIITEKDILYAISNIINCDLVKDKEAILRDLLNELDSSSHLQDSAINRVMVNVKYKLYNDNELLSLLFIGSSGIGKSRFVDIIAKNLCRNKIVIDFNDYSYEESLNKFLGSNYNNKYLLQDIRNNPCSVIEVINYDNGCYKMKELFKSIISNGYCNDYLNEKIYFNNSIIIFSITNRETIGFNNQYNEDFDIDVNDVVMFNSLTRNDLVDYIMKYNKENNVNIDIDYMLNNCDYINMGYKGINKTIEKYLRNNMIKAL